MQFATFSFETFLNIFQVTFTGFLSNVLKDMFSNDNSGEWRFGTITGVGSMHWKSGARWLMLTITDEDIGT